MAAAESRAPKWESKACADLKGVTADQVWPLLEDFFNVHKWLPAITTCQQVEGVSGQPGCIRYCATESSESGGGEEKVSWVKERLVAFDPVERGFSYEVIENNMGISSYMATFKVLPADEEDGKSKNGCKIEWSYVADPIDGLEFEGFNSYIDSSLQAMAKSMEEALLLVNSS